jgi:hypothetical protein
MPNTNAANSQRFAKNVYHYLSFANYRGDAGIEPIGSLESSEIVLRGQILMAINKAFVNAA